MKIAILFVLLIPVLLQAQSPVHRDGYIKAGKLSLHYQSTGTGAPLLLLHAGFQELHMWNHQVAYFSNNYQVITMDLPGHGLTKGTDTVLQIAEVIRLLMDSLHIAKATVIGLSLGSVCAMDFALAYPDRVNKLVLVCPGLTGAQEVVKVDSLSNRLFTHSDSVFAGKNNQLKAANFTELWCDGPFRKPAEVNAAVRNYVLQTTAKNDLSHHRGPVFNTIPAAKRIDQLHLPVLIITASLDVPLILAIGKYIHHQVQDSRLHMIQGAAHMVNMEKPEELNAILSDFLEATP